MQGNLEIRSITGNRFVFKANMKHTVHALKKVLSAKLQVDQKNLHFIFHKKELPDNTTVEKIDIKPDSYIIYYESPKSKDDIVKSQPPTPPQPIVEEPAQEEMIKIDNLEIERSRFDDYVAFLHNMGFQKNQCVSALKFTHFQLAYAADILCTGNIPKEFSNSEFEKKFSVILDKLRSKKLNQERIDLISSKFTQDEKKSIRNLIELGISEDQAIQAFIALDRNEAVATNLLISMLE